MHLLYGTCSTSFCNLILNEIKGYFQTFTWLQECSQCRSRLFYSNTRVLSGIAYDHTTASDRNCNMILSFIKKNYPSFKISNSCNKILPPKNYDKVTFTLKVRIDKLQQVHLYKPVEGRTHRSNRVAWQLLQPRICSYCNTDYPRNTPIKLPVLFLFLDEIVHVLFVGSVLFMQKIR